MGTPSLPWCSATLPTLTVFSLLLLVSGPGGSLAFNLEPRIAIVKRGPVGSYFGYSVAQHQIVDRISLKSVALVGAPRDNSSQPGTQR